MNANVRASRLYQMAHFLRWRTIALRYAGKLRGLTLRRRAGLAPARTLAARALRGEGHAPGPAIPEVLLAQIAGIYRPRVAHVEERDSGHPFVNLFRAEDIAADNPVITLAFSSPVLDIADDYFSGRFVLDSLQVLYSYPTRGELRESQMWHKDFGDSRSLHWIAYLNDVSGADDGPFVFVDKPDARRIARSVFIRRIPDVRFMKELGDGRVRQFLGRQGESMFVDPAACYHSGSRCRNARLALFVTFNTDRPFVAPTPLVRENRQPLFDVARRARPDLNDEYLKRLLQLR
jgi:hypothetical protein